MDNENDVMKIDHFSIEDTALDTLDKFNITQPVVDVIYVSNEFGVNVEEVEMPEKYRDVAGFYDANKKTIYISKNDPPERKQFSIAHELGHIILGHRNYEVLFRVPHKEALYPKEEREANSFAAHLLMPDFMIKEYLKKYNLTKNDYIRMAKIFGVPVIAMKHTLEYLR